MSFPEHLSYTESHEWVLVEDSIATIGITDYAQGELGDVVYVDIPEKRAVARGETFGSIEAVKTVSDLVAPVSGEITEVNAELENSPDLVNTDPYGKGWMVKMTVSNHDELASLLTAENYKALIGK